MGCYSWTKTSLWQLPGKELVFRHSFVIFNGTVANPGAWPWAEASFGHFNHRVAIHEHFHDF
jgi:hypothetical protein